MNHFCKVGATTPITSGAQAVAVLEYRYQNFLSKASDIEYADAALREFFETKARQIQKVLEEMV